MRKRSSEIRKQDCVSERGLILWKGEKETFAKTPLVDYSNNIIRTYYEDRETSFVSLTFENREGNNFRKEEKADIRKDTSGWLFKWDHKKLLRRS